MLLLMENNSKITDKKKDVYVEKQLNKLLMK